jgi:hypothetical protein
MNVITVSFATLILAGVPPAKMPEIASQIDRGRETMREGDRGRAEEIFQSAVATARNADDDISVARALFFLGLLKHEAANKISDRAVAVPLYESARDLYAESEEKYPASSSTIANLAEVYEALGNSAETKATLGRGLALGQRTGYFAGRLAEIYANEGNGAAALPFYRAAVGADGVPPGLDKKLIDASLTSPSDNEFVISVLWEVLHNGAADEVLLGAIRGLTILDLDSEERDAMYGVVAATLARQNYSQQQLAELNVLQDFLALAEKERYRTRAESLQALLQADFSKRADYEKWPRRVDDDDLPKDLSPRRSLADLSIALGRRALADQQVERAENYFELARDLGRNDDLLLAADLAGIYFGQRRLSELQKLTRETDAVLYADGGVAAQKDLVQLYEFHRRMGTYHAMLEPQRPINTTSAALAQLRRAVDAAELHSIGLVAAGKPAFEVDPGVLKLLNRGVTAASR